MMGFGGPEITAQNIVQVKSSVPPHWKSLTVKGVGRGKKTFTVK
jgi:hypothetical protein